MAARTHNIQIEQGTTFREKFQVLNEDGNAIDLAGYTVRSHMRTGYGASSFIVFAIENVNLSAGEFNLTLTDTQTTDLDPLGNAANKQVYDIELVDLTGEVVRFVQGTVKVSPEVTKT